MVGLFAILGPRCGLLGAVIASGGSVCASNMVLLLVARHSAPIKTRFIRDYSSFIVTGTAIAGLTIQLQAHAVGLLAAAAACVLIFLCLARYSRRQLLELVNCFLPVFRNKVIPQACAETLVVHE